MQDSNNVTLPPELKHDLQESQLALPQEILTSLLILIPLLNLPCRSYVIVQASPKPYVYSLTNETSKNLCSCHTYRWSDIPSDQQFLFFFFSFSISLSTYTPPLISTSSSTAVPDWKLSRRSSKLTLLFLSIFTPDRISE